MPYTNDVLKGRRRNAASVKKLNQFMPNNDFVLCLHDLDWNGVGRKAYTQAIEEEGLVTLPERHSRHKNS